MAPSQPPSNLLPLLLLLSHLSPTTGNSQVFSATDTATVYGCNSMNGCNGHGTCWSLRNTCNCTRGHGDDQEKEWLGYRPSYDCSLRTCPFGHSFGGIPEPNGTDTSGGDGAYSDNTAKAHDIRECSERGSCDRETGLCVCYEGFRGSACENMACPGKGDCSGHGKCLPMKVMAQMDNAMPLSSAQAVSTGGSSSYYQSDEHFTTTWGQQKISGCVCDSSWEVGLGSGQRQEAEWYGPDCSFRRCPSGDNPDTSADELDCNGVVHSGGRGTGLAGNVCHHDCSGKGKCDVKTGACACFLGHYGEACQVRDVNAIG